MARGDELGRGETDADSVRYYCLSILDKHHHPDCSLEEGLALLTLCTDELKRRLPIDYKGVSSIRSHPRMPFILTQLSKDAGEGRYKGRRARNPSG